MVGDAGHLHRGHDLVRLPIESHRGLSGRIAVLIKQTLRRLLHPLPQAQSIWNGAAARVITLLLHEFVDQAKSIESLEAEVEHLRKEIDQISRSTDVDKAKSQSDSKQT